MDNLNIESISRLQQLSKSISVHTNVNYTSLFKGHTVYFCLMIRCSYSGFYCVLYGQFGLHQIAIDFLGMTH